MALMSEASALQNVVNGLCEAERERLTMIEVSIDEAMVILERHGMGVRNAAMRDLASLSGDLHDALTIADGPLRRLARIQRVRDTLTKAFPLTDEDLGA